MNNNPAFRKNNNRQKRPSSALLSGILECPLLNADPKTQLPRLCNFQMLQLMVGSPARVIGRVISIDGTNLILQTTDGAKVTCRLKQPPSHRLSQIVEVIGMVTVDNQARGGAIYLDQYGLVTNMEETIRLPQLNEAINYMNKPRFAKYFTLMDDNILPANLSL